MTAPTNPINNIISPTTERDISKLDISINVRNKTIDFKPRMVNRYASYNEIFFIPTIPMTLDDLKHSGVINKKNAKVSDFINVFTSLYELTNVLKRIKQNKTFRGITLNKAEEKGFIKKTISLILDIFFNKDNKLTYQGRTYPIFSYFWNGEYKPITFTNKKYPNYSIEIELEILDSNKVGSETDNIKYDCYSRKKRLGLIDETYIEETPTPNIFSRGGPITIKTKRGGKKIFKRYIKQYTKRNKKNKTTRNKTTRNKTTRNKKIKLII
jgi:hypothetical protein